MADKRDYYEVLGVSKEASESEIKSAFRKAAKSCHPDLHPGDQEAEARFKELNEAYEVLSDAEKRQQYDRFGHAAFDPSQGGGQNPFNGGYGFGGFSDIFETMFNGGFGGGGNRNPNRPMPGNDLRYNLTLAFEEAAFGTKKEITVPREESCSVCGGNGAKPGTEPVRCSTCGGTGQVRTQQNTVLGSFVSTRPCSTCGGAGKTIKDPCTGCRGTGRVRKNSRIMVNVPGGIDHGQTMNLHGEGEAGTNGGERGDLYVTINLKPHKNFTRRGFDLYTELAIPYTTAVLGGEITVPTLTETLKYKIPGGTQSGTTFRLRDQGTQRLHNTGRGDLLVTVSIAVPKHVTDRERELLELLASPEGTPAKSGKKSIFSKLKND